MCDNIPITIKTWVILTLWITLKTELEATFIIPLSKSEWKMACNSNRHRGWDESARRWMKAEEEEWKHLFKHSYLVEVSLTGGAGGLSSSSDMLKGGKGWPNVLNLAVYAVIQNNKSPLSSSRPLPPCLFSLSCANCHLSFNLILRLPSYMSLFKHHPCRNTSNASAWQLFGTLIGTQSVKGVKRHQPLL